VCGPAPRRVLEELPALLQVAQRLDREKCVAAGLCHERVPERRSEPVGLAVHIGLDKGAAVRTIEVDEDLALEAAQLIDSRGQRVAGDLAGPRVAPAECDGCRAVRAEDEQAAVAELAAQAEEKGRGGLVYPLQVIEEQEHGLLPCDGGQGADQLIKEDCLPHRLHSPPRPAPERGLPGRLGCGAGPAGGQGASGRDGRSVYERVDKARPVFCERGQGEVSGAQQPVNLLPTGQPPGCVAAGVAEEHLGELAQGCEGVSAPAWATAGASYQQVGMPGHGSGGKGFEQHRLAAARVPGCEGYLRLAGQCSLQMAAELPQLTLPRHQPQRLSRRTGRHGRGIPQRRGRLRWGCDGDKLARADGVIQRSRAGSRLDVQLGPEDVAACLVLVQRFVAAPCQGQGAHAAAVRVFQPGLELELEASRGRCLLILAAGLEGRVLVVQDVKSEAVVELLLAQHPGLEGLAARHGKAGQEIGAQRDRQKLPAPGRQAGERLQLGHVGRVIAGRIELHIGGGDKEERRRVVRIVQRVPQA